MPTYDYECKGCGHEFQKDQRITENPVKKCPSCGTMKAKRLISRTNFVLKGSGWYNDLYSSSAGKKDAGGESPAEGASESKSDSKTDSKDSGKKAAKKSDGGGSKKKTKGQAAA